NRTPMTSRRLWRGGRWAALLGVAASLAASSCGSGSAVNKTTATFAELPGSGPNYILPLAAGKYFSVANLTQFQFLLYRPLYWFGSNGQVALNKSLSLANEPQYAADGKSVTVTLKSYKWSDGQPVTSRDIEFWQNLVTANKASWAAYSPGEYPDNVTSTSVNSPSSITFHLSQAYGSYFFTYNELSQITPLPQHVWDKESAAGAIGDYDRTSAGAQAVYKFLDSQATNVAGYNNNPLWQVVDGPWKLKSLDTNGNLKLVPNTTYSGPVKPKLTEFDEVPFTKDTAEFNLLKGGTSPSNAIDYGYLPSQDVSQKDQITQLGYKYVPWTGWQITYFPENFTNPTSGPIFTQPYFRQAMQMLIDQTTYINKAFNGAGYPTYGPVPIKPPNTFVDQVEQSNPYPFSVTKAVSLLQSNGWTVNPNGISTCSNAGTDAGQCGAGVPAGAQASFKLEYVSGTPAIDAEINQLKNDFAKAGIQINTSTAPFETVIGDATPCTPGQACKWDMQFWGGGWIYAPDYYPTGDEIFSTGAGSNYGGFSDPMLDQLIMNTQTSSDVKAIQQYEDYAAKTLPVIWMPTAYAQLSMINTHLQGAEPQDPLLNIYPESWSWS
ncbi:MAG: peptide ABC transporter substrate-binding protein, partial [Candidatus Dormibacteria bacterium]